MKLTILSAIVTGALALDPAEKFYWKRDNSSAIANTASGGITGIGGSTGTGAVLPGSSATPDLTTLVIATTIVETVTKCKPTVVSCPVDSGGMSSLPPDAVYTDYTTSTIIIATTVCPVSEVAQVSSSVLSSISEANLGVPTGGEITATQPLSPIDTATGDVANGGGGSTDGYMGGNGGGGTTDANMGVGGDTTTDATTTITKTTRATSTITVTRVPSSSPGSGSGGGVGNGSPECTPVTVFITKPAETVYVSVMPDTGIPPATTGVNSSPDAGNPPVSEDDDEDCPAEEEPASTSELVVEVTATVVPYPANSTTPETPLSAGSNSAMPSNAYSRFGRRSPHHF